MTRSRPALIAAILAAVVAAPFACSTDQGAQRAPSAAPAIDYASLLGGGPRKVVAVAAFDDRTDGSVPLGGSAADLVVGHLSRSGGFIVVERSRIDQVLGEQALSASGATGGLNEDILGQLRDVNAIILGSVVDFGIQTVGTSAVVTQSRTQTARARVSVRAIDIRTGQVIVNAEGQGEAQSESRRVLGVGSSGGYDETLAGRALEAAIADLVPALIRGIDTGLPWSARVARVEGAEVLINAGTDQGIREGMIFDVLQPGELITDPETGAPLGRAEDVLKARIEAIRILGPQLTRCRVTESHRPLRNNDLVQLGQAPAAAPGTDAAPND